MKLLGMTMLIVGIASLLQAGPTVSTPEIDPGSAGTALALITGALLVFKGRKS